jgi:signal recognition particle GTPase
MRSVRFSSPLATVKPATGISDHSPTTMSSINDLATAAMATKDESGQRGAFIVLEGLDRSGKTTQVKLLEQRFVEEGKKVKVMRFPGMLIDLR